MNKTKFFIVVIILVCVGAIADFAITTISTKSLLNVCQGEECTNTIKEWTPLTTESKNDESAEGTALSEEAESAETLDESLISPKESKTVDHLYYSADENVETDSDTYYTRNSFLAGMNVTLNQAGVDGLLFAAGNTIKSHGVQNYLVTAGNDISIDSTSNKDVFAAGNLIDFSKNASARDVFLAGQTVTIRGNISGSLHVAAKDLIIDNATIGEDVDITVSSLEMKGDSKIFGTLNYNVDALTTNVDKNKIGGIKTYISPSLSKQSSTAVVALKIVKGFCVTAVSIALLAALLAHVASKRYEALLKSQTGTRDLGLGAITLLILPAVIVLFIFVNYLTPIGILLAALFASAMIIGSAVAAVRFGKLANQYVLKTKDNSIYGTVLAGAITFALIAQIPVLGGLIIFFAVIAGFGYTVGELVRGALPKMKSYTYKNSNK